MKRNIIILAALAIVVLCSCQKEDLQTTKNIIDATVEAPSDDASKTTLGEDFSLNWASGDKFEVYHNGNLSTRYAFCTLTGGEGTTKGKFSVSPDVTLTSAYIAYYPYINSSKYWRRPSEGGKLQWTLDNYALSPSNPMPMFGKFTSDNAVSFKPLYSVLKFVSKSGRSITNLNFNLASANFVNSKIVGVAPNGTISYSGNDASFNVASNMVLIKPFEVSGGQKITVTVTYSDSSTKTYTITAFGIEVGHIKTFKVE